MILFKPSNSPQDQADQSEFAFYLITPMDIHLSQLLYTYHSLYENIQGILSLCNICQRAKKVR